MLFLCALLITAFSTAFSTAAQDLSGAWKIAYIRSLEEVLSLDGSEEANEKMESFSAGTGIIEFSDKLVQFHNFREKPLTARIRKDKIFKLHGEKFKVDSFNKDSIVLNPTKDEYTYIVLKPFVSEGIQLNASDFKEIEWQIESDFNSIVPLKLYFHDSTIVTLRYSKKGYGYANYGEWKLATSGKYQGLYIIDQEDVKEYFFYLRSKSNNRLSAEVSIQEWHSFPDEILVTFVKNSPPLKADLKKKVNQLEGKWSFSRFVNKMETIILDSILSVDFSIQFRNNGHYEFKNTVQFVGDEQKRNYSNTEKGSWDLDKYGAHLVIISDSGKKGVPINTSHGSR